MMSTAFSGLGMKLRIGLNDPMYVSGPDGCGSGTCRFLFSISFSSSRRRRLRGLRGKGVQLRSSQTSDRGLPYPPPLRGGERTRAGP